MEISYSKLSRIIVEETENFMQEAMSKGEREKHTAKQRAALRMATVDAQGRPNTWATHPIFQTLSREMVRAGDQWDARIKALEEELETIKRQLPGYAQTQPKLRPALGPTGTIHKGKPRKANEPRLPQRSGKLYGGP